MTNKRQKPAAIALLWVLLFAGAFPAFGQSQRSQPSRSSARAARAPSQVKLVVGIVVDQFRYDFLDRFRDLLGKDGFVRLMNQGAVFASANYSYVPTYTAPGHAAIFTGSVPAQNGIVGNQWFDRDSGRVRTTVSDDAARLVTNEGVSNQTGAPSPRILIGSTVGDQMRLATGFQSKVIAVSYKDRSAVLPGGQHPNGAFWFNAFSGMFVTSDYYSKELPAWVRRFNTDQRPDKYFGAKWEHALADGAYQRAQADYTAPQASQLGKKFPYTVTGGEDKPGAKFYNAFELTPFASEYLADFARAAVEAESLGADQFPDLLSISFSTPDLVGHAYGPDSQEVLDTYVRLDRVIADLLSYIDRRVGLANTIIFVTGDHGVSPVPEYMSLLGFDAQRISGTRIIDAVKTALTARFGEGKWILGFVSDQLYLNRNLIAERKADPSEVERVAGEAALSVPGIINFFTRTQIIEGRMPADNVAQRVANGFHRARSGDVWVITKPFYFIADGSLATTHGSPYNYDTHVPVILFGTGVRAGLYYGECSPSDITPTLAALLGIEPPPNRVGRVLAEALAAESAKSK